MASLLDILFASGERAVTFLLRAGKSIGQVFTNLLNRFPGTNQRTLNAVLSASQRASALAGDLNTAPPDTKIPRSNYPRNPTIVSAYRYGVQIGFEGGADDELAYRYVEIQSDSNLTNSEVFARALDAADQFSDGQHSGQLAPGVDPGGTFAEIVLAERRT